MPVTKQTTTQGGSDADNSTRNGKSVTEGTSTSHKTGKGTTERKGTTKTHQTGKKVALASTTTQTGTGGQVATEDYSFQATWTIRVNQPIPCELIGPA